MLLHVTPVMHISTHLILDLPSNSRTLSLVTRKHKNKDVSPEAMVISLFLKRCPCQTSPEPAFFLAFGGWETGYRGGGRLT